ncbi:MAG TPA: sodium-independent anion transporter, partial [Porphyromonadaceae bacterium]|nr:sodium-independent anion transporter [Porphyromonadaceae bacterium]
METKTTGEREGIFSKVMSTLSYHPKLMESLKGYNMTMLKSDMMAGLVVGIVSLPLGIAFGIASGVTPEQGLITSIIAGVIISLFGGTRVQIGGSTGTFVVVIYGVVQEFGPIGMFLATFLAGVFLLLFGVLKLGTVIKYIPYPIVVGFTGGIAMSILSTQIKDFLGLSIEGKLPNDFIEKWIVCFQNIGTINWWSFGAGLLSLFIIFVGPKFIKKVPGSLLAILLVTTLVFLLKKFLGINGIETIGDRFSINGSLSSTEFPQISWGNLKGVVTPAFTIAMLGA